MPKSDANCQNYYDITIVNNLLNHFFYYENLTYFATYSNTEMPYHFWDVAAFRVEKNLILETQFYGTKNQNLFIYYPKYNSFFL